MNFGAKSCVVDLALLNLANVTYARHNNVYLHSQRLQDFHLNAMQNATKTHAHQKIEKGVVRLWHMKIKGVRSPHALCPILSDLGVQ